VNIRELQGAADRRDGRRVGAINSRARERKGTGGELAKRRLCASSDPQILLCAERSGPQIGSLDPIKCRGKYAIGNHLNEQVMPGIFNKRNKELRNRIIRKKTGREVYSRKYLPETLGQAERGRNSEARALTCVEAEGGERHAGGNDGRNQRRLATGERREGGRDRGRSLSPAPVNCFLLFLPRLRAGVAFRSLCFVRPPPLSSLHSTSHTWVAYMRACVQGMQTKSGDRDGAASDANGLMKTEECEQPGLNRIQGSKGKAKRA
jgi:hypothetical protein